MPQDALHYIAREKNVRVTAHEAFGHQILGVHE
jgi:hypothetical protein